jgi:hypothetical protein
MYVVNIYQKSYLSLNIYIPPGRGCQRFITSPTFVDGFVDGFIQGYPNGYFLGRCPRSIANNWFITLFFSPGLINYGYNIAMKLGLMVDIS